MRLIMFVQTAILAFFISVISTVSVATEYFTIDSNHTFPYFAIDHMGFSTLYGRFDLTTGKVIIDRENNNGYVDIKIEAVSISTGHKKRDDHLRSPDFLNVMEYPNITYQSKNINFIGEDKAKIEGDLTMLGVTKSVPLEVNRIRCGENPMSKKHTCGFEATASIKRSDFGSIYGRPNIGDNMKLWFEVEAIRE
jgi:polyisoprenoid-binding protein YceI